MGLFRNRKKKKAAEAAAVEAAAAAAEETKNTYSHSSASSRNKVAGQSVRRKILSLKSKTPNQSNNFTSPTNTIGEQAERGTGQTAAETPQSVLSAVQVQSSGGRISDNDDAEDVEMVYGNDSHQDSHPHDEMQPETPVISNKNLAESKQIEEEEESNGVRKKLFTSDNQPDDEERVPSPAEEEEPFDAKAYYEKDEMADLDNEQGHTGPSGTKENSVTKRLLDAFNCNEDTTADVSRCIGAEEESRNPIVVALTSCGGDQFYDTACAPYIRGKKRPYYNKQFTLQFLREIVKVGIPLMWHQESTNDSEEWSGRSVNLFVRQGNFNGSEMLQPKLEWLTMGGGLSSEVSTTSIDLLNIVSILDSSAIEHDPERGPPDFDLNFFTITTTSGDVYLFEAQTYEERDRVVNGLKNIIARFVYYLVAGNAKISAELYTEDVGLSSGELPSLKTPSQTMNDISHSFLD